MTLEEIDELHRLLLAEFAAGRLIGRKQTRTNSLVFSLPRLALESLRPTSRITSHSFSVTHHDFPSETVHCVEQSLVMEFSDPRETTSKIA